MSVFRTSVLACSLLTLAACTQVDNSGGEPPAGDPLQFAIGAEPAAFCEGIDAARFLDAQDDIDGWIEDCQADEVARGQIEDAFAALEESESLVLVSAQLGGCIGDYEVAGAYLDEGTLHMWMLKEDSSYGRQDVACTADIGEGHTLVVVDGAAEATDIDLTVGIWNPELPGGPVVALDE